MLVVGLMEALGGGSITGKPPLRAVSVLGHSRMPMEWPANSADLNPTEPSWDRLGRAAQ